MMLADAQRYVSGKELAKQRNRLKSEDDWKNMFMS